MHGTTSAGRRRISGSGHGARRSSDAAQATLTCILRGWLSRRWFVWYDTSYVGVVVGWRRAAAGVVPESANCK